MADSLLKENALRLAISDELALAYNVQYPTLSAIANKVFARQQLIKWNADVGGAGVTIKDLNEDATSSQQGAVEPANLAIGQTAITHTFDLVLNDVTEAAAVGIEPLRNLFQAHVNRGLIKIYRQLNTLLFTGTGIKADARVIGMEKVIDNTYSYAGIAPASFPGWSSVLGVPASGTTPRALTKELLTNMETRLLNAEAAYDLIITTPEIVETYKNVFNASRSFMTSGESNQRADMGISDVFYNGRPVLADPACTAGTMYFVDSTEIFLHTYRVKEDAVNSGMAIKIGTLPTQSIYTEKWEIGVIPQLQAYSRKAVNALRYIQ